MYYIFDKDGVCVCSCDYEVDKDDLASRNEAAVQSEENYEISDIKLVNGAIVVIEPEPPTDEELQQYFEDAIEAYMDSVVQTRNYKNIHTAASYVNSTNEKFAKEGAACNKWRDDVWDKCYAILAEVKAGVRAVPTLEEVIAELPVLEW